MPRRSGRPPIPVGEHATVPVILKQRDVESLDHIIRNRFLAQAARPSSGEPEPRRRPPQAAERRELLGEIIQTREEIETAVSVTITAPCPTDKPEWQREADEWVAEAEKRLAAEAPIGVRVALARRALRQIDRLNPEALARLFSAASALLKDR